MEEKNSKSGFEVGLRTVYNTRTAKEYEQCLAECIRICTTTETTGNSRSSFYNKRYGRKPLTVAESTLIAAIFANYGITEWQGCA